MRSNTRSSTTNQGNNNKGGAMEVEKLKKLKDEPHLSGAYIRNLVKQLTSSRKEPSLPNMNKQGQDVDHVDENEQNQGTTTNHSMSSPKNQPQQQPQQPKKQVRRRLHTSRPYQERLLNMAEARREIVTALKFHRASMKQASEQQQQQQQQSQSLHNPSSFEHEQQERSKYRRNPRIYPSNTTTTTTNNNNNFTNYLENSSYSSFSCPTPCLMQPNNHFLSSPYIEPTLPIIDHLNLTTFPNHQPLGLNLNFHDFNNLDTTSLYYNNNNTQFSSMYSYPSPSPSSSPPPTLASSSTTEETHSFVTSPDGVLPHSFPMTHKMIDATGEDNGLHPTMDDDEMAEIRSIGEQHEMEWNDTLNLVTSAWWFKYLKKMEINNNNSHDHNKGGLKISSDEDGIMSSSNLFDEVMEFPSWMNANNTNDGDESFFLQQHLDDSYYSDNKDYFQESALPCMDIGEIDGMDNEWLA